MTLFDQPANVNGQQIKAGDLVYAKYVMYSTFTRIVDDSGVLYLLQGPGPYMFKVSLFNFISNGGEVSLVRPVDVYRFCKKNGWNFKYYVPILKQ